MTKDEAVNELMYADRDALLETVSFMYKDQYGHEGPHISSYTVAELVSWMLSHYDWSHEEQCWVTKAPFDEEFEPDVDEDGEEIVQDKRVLH